MSSTPASKLARPAPFTPKRPLSTSSSTEISRLARAGTPSNLLSTTHKKYKASLSTESRSRSYSKSKSPLSTVPGSPARSESRPRTPGTPKRAGSDSPMLCPATSEMDVSRVDPEEVLVDFETLEPGDVSGEFEDGFWAASEHGNHDKVMVSVRMRPSNSLSAWNVASSNSIHLDPSHYKSGQSTSGRNNTTFHFDSVLTGSPNKPIYTTVGRSHVCAAMEGFNAVIFAYGQTASGKTYTLSGDDAEPGIIPRSMKDVFAFIRRTPSREYLLRCSYLEIYNETIHDLLAPPSSSLSNVVHIQGGVGNEIILTPLREEVVTSLKGVKEVLKRGEAHRRTASTDWNERSSRSHSVFRLVIESRERGDVPSGRSTPGFGGRQTPGLSGRQTPGLGSVPPTPGGSRLQARGGRSVQTSVLSLIDLAGSEKATSDKERTREGKYINTSLLTLGTVIGTLAENNSKQKSDHVPYRNSKLTRMLQPSLSGNARISVVCTINPDSSAIAETTSTLLFARRIKSVKLNAQKKEIVDTDALIEKYRKEIEDLKARLADKEAAVTEAPVRSRRLSAQEKVDESKAMKDLNNRIQQLTKLILTSQTLDDTSGDSRPASPVKVDFDLSPYQLQQELLAARHQLETQATQILSLEAALQVRPALSSSASESEKDKLIAEQTKTIRELEIVVSGYEENLGEPLRAVREDVEKEWQGKVEEEVKKRKEKERWADELLRQLDKEKKLRLNLDEERRALAAFVNMFDSLGASAKSSTPVTSKITSPTPTRGGASTAFTERKQNCQASVTHQVTGDESPMRIDFTNKMKAHPSLLDQMPEEEWSMLGDISFELDDVKVGTGRKMQEDGKENQFTS